MSTDTFLDMANQAKKEIGVEGSDMATLVGQVGMFAKLRDWTAKSDLLVQSLHEDWDFLWSQHSSAVVATETVIVSPATLGHWDKESFYLDRGTVDATQLPWLRYKDWRRDYGSQVLSTETPTTIIIKPDNSLMFDTISDGSYTFTADYWKRPASLSADTDVSVIPSQFRNIVVERTKMFFAEEQEFPGLLQTATDLYNQYLTHLKAQYLPDQVGDEASGAEFTVIPE